MGSLKQKQAYDLFGIPLTNIDSYAEAAESIVARVRETRKTFCVAVNPEKIYRAQKDLELKRLINTADFHICDGVGAAIAVKLLYGTSIGRVTGVQLFYNLMAKAASERLSIYLLGASPASNSGAVKALQEKHPELKIAGYRDGYFDDDQEVISSINASGADMLFVAMGSPRQEKWISSYRNQIDAPYCMGVGGTFDVVSGNVKWAPKIFRKTGTEFLYRLVCDPRRLKRQACYPVFMMKVVKARLFKNMKW